MKSIMTLQIRRALRSVLILGWLLTRHPASAGAQNWGLAGLKEFTNKDGSRLRYKWEESPQDGISVNVQLRAPNAIKRNGHKVRWRNVLSLRLSPDQGPFSGAGLGDIDNDGFAELWIDGMCGNVNCPTDIYRYDSNSGSFYHFYSGTAIEAIEDGYLIEAGRSSCCSWEYHIYRIPERPRLMSFETSLLFGIRVESTDSDESGRSTASSCKFFEILGSKADVEEKVIKPPAEKWLRYCKGYGADYVLLQPEERAGTEEKPAMAIDSTEQFPHLRHLIQGLSRRD